ncbi:shikimate kinase [Legionella shakespearei]|uniref:Shikimate kinase n=1 Tax=Legionella shakespearei DSM 23087 TaxID=1122169 RepID=A0A0W0Z3P1_9GAMM|nr:shikimate kinase [Legionella shakespearei]KTD63471.1 shikimate kinase [Legionella shakespearei DSM 23087]
MKELKRIFVVGHPAAGKAYFSKHLAERLGYKFVDADMGLEHRIGLTISEILGQAGLKQYEHTQEVIFDSLSKQSGIVVGLDCHVGNTLKIQEYLKNACVVFIKTTLETQIRRGGSQHVPLTNVHNIEDVLKTLHDERNEYYNQISDIVLSTDDGNVDNHIDIVMAFLKQNGFTLVDPGELADRELVYFKYNTDIPVRISEQQAISLKHLSKGKTAKEIAREMNISYRTVEVYIAQLKEKLECDSSKDLISIYLFKH